MCVKGERRSLPPQKQTVSHMGERLPCSRPVPLRLVKLRFPRLRPARHCFRSPFLSCPIAMRRGIIVPCPATPAALAVGRREGTSAICLRCYMPKRACLSGLTLQKSQSASALEHFRFENAPPNVPDAKRSETEAAAPPSFSSPVPPQFTCGVQLRRRRETCDPEHRAGRYFQWPNAPKEAPCSLFILPFISFPPQSSA